MVAVAGGVVAGALVKVADGFLNAAGAKVFDLLFGGIFGSSGGVDLKELSRIFAETLEVFSNDLKLHVDGAFAAERLHQAELSFKRLTSLMRLYSESNTSSSDLLDECVIAANDTVIALQDIGHTAVVQYVTAVTLLIAVYEARMIEISKDQKNTITGYIVPEGVAVYKRMRDTIATKVSERAEISYRTIWNIPGNGEVGGVVVSIIVDGETIKSRGFAGELGPWGKPEHDDFLALLASERKKLQDELDISMQPTDKMVSAWTEKYPESMKAIEVRKIA